MHDTVDSVMGERAIVADELALARLGVISVLHAQGVDVVAETHSGRELVSVATLERPDLQTCYDLVTEYFATNRTSPATYARALEHFGERGLVEIIGAVGLYGLVSMTLNVFDVPLPEGATPPFEE